MTKTKHEQVAVVYQGGERDGTVDELDADVTEVTHEVGRTPHDETYVRNGDQHGDHWVFRFTAGDGEPVGGAGTIDGTAPHNTLEHDLAVLADDRKKNPKVKGVSAS